MSNEPSVRPAGDRSIKVKPLALAVAVGAGLIAGLLVGYLVFSTRALNLVVLATIPATSKGDCVNPPPIGHRPLCATTIWSDFDRSCSIDGLQATTCACYETQVRSCVIGHPNLWCPPGSAGCGQKTCSVTDDTHSVWGPCI
jgi:hypothetical protein